MNICIYSDEFIHIFIIYDTHIYIIYIYMGLDGMHLKEDNKLNKLSIKGLIASNEVDKNDTIFKLQSIF